MSIASWTEAGRFGISKVAYIRIIEYDGMMPDPDVLRSFKAEIFQALAHPTRIAIVEALRDTELSAGQLIEVLELEQANASQHLAVLRSRQIVVNRKRGNQVFYSLRDPALSEVLVIMRRYFKNHIAGAKAAFDELGRLEVKRR